MSRRLVTAVVVTLAGATLALALGLAWYVRERPIGFYTDADTIRRPASEADPRDVLWRPAERLGATINSETDEYEPKLSPDGTTLFFVRGKAGGDADIVVSVRTPEGWTEPRPIDAINSDADELGPEPSADGTRLYFYSNRDGGLGGYDLWVARRVEAAWEAPENLGGPVNTGFNEYGPALTPDGGTLYFSSNRPGPGAETAADPEAWPATVREELYRRDYDLYAVAITGRGFGAPAPVDPLNSAHHDGAPAISPVGDFIYFCSDRPGGSGGFDLYRSRRLRGGHEPPEHLSHAVNTPANELDPALDLGGFGLHFSSDRAAGDYDLYHTTSREVFTETETERAEIDWAALLSYLLWLLTALLALLLLWLLGRLMTSERLARLSLLARCLLASMLMHVLILVLLMFWGVGNSFSNWMKSGGGTRVAIVSPAIGDGAAAQVRGSLTDIDVEAEPAPSSRARLEPAQDRPALVLVALTLDRNSIEATPLAKAKDEDRESPSRPAPPAAPAPIETTLRPLDVALAFPAAPPARARGEQATELSAPALPAPARHELSAARRPDPEAPPIDIALTPVPVAPGTVTAPAPAVDTAAPALALVRTAPPSAVSPPRPIDVELPRLPGRRPATKTEPATALDHSALAPASAPIDALPPPSSRPPAPAAPRTATLPPPAVMEHESIVLDAGARDAGESAGRRDPLPVLLALDGPPPTDVALPAAGPARDDPPAEAAMQIAPPPRPAAARRRADARARRSADAPPTARIEPVTVADAAEAGRVSLFPPAPPRQALATGRALPAPEFDVRRFKTPTTVDLDLRLPAWAMPPPNPHRQRARQERMEIVREMGGSEETERAVALALDWLARHQSEHGGWDSDGFDDACGACGGETRIEVDVAITGLSLLCFLATDHTHAKDGPYRDVVAHGLGWLRSVQERDGGMMAGESMYSHGIATIALAEAYGMTGDPDLRPALEAAVRFIVGARNRDTGGWRYAPGQPGDTSVLGWQIMALSSARHAGIDVPEDAFDAARRWLDLVASPRERGRYAYQPHTGYTPAMTAEGMFVQLLLGRRPDEPFMRASARSILAHPPDWENDPNTYYWYYGTLALYQHQGETWGAWNEMIKDQLLAHQSRSGRTAGSWDPGGQWAKTGGRVYQTAICTLTLEVYYRYLPGYLKTVGDDEPALTRPRPSARRSRPRADRRDP